MFTKLEQLLIIPLKKKIWRKIVSHELELRREIISLSIPRLKILSLVSVFFIAVLLYIDVSHLDQGIIKKEYLYYYYLDLSFIFIVLMMLIASFIFPENETAWKIRIKGLLIQAVFLLSLCWSAGISAVEYGTTGSVLTFFIVLFIIISLFYPGSLFLFFALPASLVFFFFLKVQLFDLSLEILSKHFNLLFVVLFVWVVSRLLHLSFYRNFFNKLQVLDVKADFEREAASHWETAEKLRIANIELEERIKERTAEISKKNVELEKEVEERNNAEELLLIAKKEAEIANRIKSRFLATMSHEIRTPLNGIIGVLQLLEHNPPSESLQEYYSLMKSASQNLMSIIEDLLDLAKIEAGTVSMSAESFSIRDWLKGIVKRFIAAGRDSQVLIESYVEDDFPAVISGYPERLSQVLSNLLENAVKFTEKGAVKILVSLYDDSGDQKILISVEDTGIGIEQDKLKFIFNSFAQIEQLTSRRFGGAGLGLAISKQLVHLMGGSIDVKSSPGKGSTFSVLLPLEIKAVKSMITEEAVVEKVRPLSILVAEDDEISKKIISHLLEKEGHCVAIAENGSEALRLYRENDYDCILMDAFMPEMDGQEVTCKIREIEKTTGSRIPIIAVTADAMSGSKERYLDGGMDDYISKPVNRSRLSAVLQKVARKEFRN